MRFTADLHVHSHLSRATSKNLTLEQLHRSAQHKGLTLVATGDFTHPKWFCELRERLVPAEPGLYALREDVARAADADVPGACRAAVRFMLSVEISSIYKHGDRVRKVHNLVYAPDFETASRISGRLATLGNIEADGRPILGLDSRNLLEIVLEASPDAFLIPAHVWTPWFSALGAQSGFDSIDECFGDLAAHVFALETGLSSDPAMNWRLSQLDRFTLVSNSDAHSPDKLGREANGFDCELSYFGVREALRRPESGFLGTIEFFPEEGKYHFDGHRDCGVVLAPSDALARDGLCPRCGKRLTPGVATRVEQLADRPLGFRPESARPYTSSIPLSELLSEVIGAGTSSGRVRKAYAALLDRVGPELFVLQEAPLETLEREGPALFAEAVRRMRAGQVEARPGFDGEYGKVRAFGEGELMKLQSQGSFGFASAVVSTRPAESPLSPSSHPPQDRPNEHGVRAGALVQDSEKPSESAPAFDKDSEKPSESAPAFDKDSEKPSESAPAFDKASSRSVEGAFDPEQQCAVEHEQGPLLIIAGPGTGKTRTLTGRIAHLVKNRAVAPEGITAVTFTRKAATELSERLRAALGPTAARVRSVTFHAWGLELLRRWSEAAGLPPDFLVLAETERDEALKAAALKLADSKDISAAARFAERISWQKVHLEEPDATDAAFMALYLGYQAELAARGAVDFDDLVSRAVRLLEICPQALEDARCRCGHLLVDEYQDINEAQYRLVRLCAPHPTLANLCIVGDPDQAIYGFRGSTPRYFESFARDYPEARVVTLRRNYRSSAAIVGAATEVIERSTGRSPRPLVPLEAASPPIEHLCMASDHDEASFIVGQIQEAIGGTEFDGSHSRRAGGGVSPLLGLHDMAVLYRTAAQARVIEQALARAGLPYSRRGTESLTARPLVNEIVRQLSTSASDEAQRTRAVADRILDLGRLDRGRFERHPLDRGRLERGRSEEEKDVAFIRASELLACLAVPFGADLDAFLAELSTSRESDLDLEAQKVPLLTLHAAKGLEFEVVFLVGCDDGLIPLLLPGAREVDREEERRILYVGMTRAKRRLIMTSARQRTLFGRTMESVPCPFLAPVSERWMQTRQLYTERNRRPRQLSLW